MPNTPRGKRVSDPSTDSFRVVKKAPWRKPDGKVGKPTGKTRVLAVASRDRHLAKAEDDKRFTDLDQGFTADTTVAELADWWLNPERLVVGNSGPCPSGSSSRRRR